MKNYFYLFLVLLFSCNSNELKNDIDQEKILFDYQKWDFKSYPENSYTWESEGLFIENISVPEMLLYRAKGASISDKTMIICPGGGLFFSAYEKEGTKLAEKLSENGINAIVLKYRLYPREGSVIKWISDKWENPKMVQDSAKTILPYSSKDALDAIAHIRSNSTKYSVNGNKIGLMGFSAGGAVTMEATYKSDITNEPNFIAPIYPWMAIVEDQKVPKSKPPAFIACANDDPLLLAAPSVKIYQEWISVGARADLHMFEKGGHGFGMFPKNLPVDSWSDLLVDWILNLE